MKTLILAFLLCVAIFTHAQDKIAYIYYSDNTNALSFETLLEGNGYLVDLVEISNVGTFNFSTYSLIVADYNSGAIGNWGTPADVQQIKNSNKPILALGIGGISLLEQIESGNLGIDWGSSAGSVSIDGFTAVDPSSTIFTSPKNISLDVNNYLQVFGTGVGSQEAYSPANGTTIGQDPSNTSYFPIATEDRYTSFGFYGTIANMTPQGKDFFVNLVNHAKNQVVLSLSSANIAPGTNILTDRENRKVYINYYSNDIKISIYDINGKFLKETSEQLIDCKELSNGVYLIKIESKNIQVIERVIL